MHVHTRRVIAGCLAAALALSLTACRGSSSSSSRRSHGYRSVGGYGSNDGGYGGGYGDPTPDPTSYGDLPTTDPSPTQTYWQDPQLSLAYSGDTVLQVTTIRTGPYTVALPEIKPGSFEVAANCQGTGSIWVDTGKAGVAFTMDCSKGSIPQTGEHQSAAPVTGAQLRVVASLGVRWQVATGWNNSK